MKRTIPFFVYSLGLCLLISGSAQGSQAAAGLQEGYQTLLNLAMRKRNDVFRLWRNNPNDQTKQDLDAANKEFREIAEKIAQAADEAREREQAGSMEQAATRDQQMEQEFTQARLDSERFYDRREQELKARIEEESNPAKKRQLELRLQADLDQAQRDADNKLFSARQAIRRAYE